MSHYWGGRFCVMLLGFVSFPIFTRLFSVAEYGLINLVIKTILIAAILAKLGVQHSVLRFYQENAVSRDKTALSRYYSTLFFGSTAIAATVTVLFVLGLWIIPKTVVSSPIRALLFLGSILIFTRGMGSIGSGFLRVEEKTKLYNVVEIAAKIVAIAAVIALVYFRGASGRAYFSGTIVADCLYFSFIGLYLTQRRVLDFRRIDVSLLREAINFGLPLIAYEVAMLILDSGDRFLVQHYLGAIQLGYYSAAYNIGSVFQDTLMYPLNMAIFPIYMRLWVTKGKTETEKFLSTTLHHYLFAAIGITALVTVVSGDAVALLASRKFQDAHRLLPVLVVGMMVFAAHIILYAGLIIEKRSGTMAKIVVSASLLNIVLNVVLLPQIGTMGAAVATLASYTFMVILIARASSSILHIRFNLVALSKYVVAALATMAIVLPINTPYGAANLFLKGCLIAGLYLGLSCLLDRKLRSAMISVFRPREALTATVRVQTETSDSLTSELSESALGKL